MTWIISPNQVHKAFWEIKRWKALCKGKIVLFKTVQQRCFIFYGDGTVVLGWGKHPQSYSSWCHFNRTNGIWQGCHHFSFYPLPSISQVTENEIKPLYYTQVNKSSAFHKSCSKNTHKLAFCTQMFISQLNIPFKHKEWILNFHKDELKMKSLQYSLCNHCDILVTTGVYCLTSKTKTGYLKIMLLDF